MEQNTNELKREPQEAQKPWTTKLFEKASSFSSSVHDALQNPIIEAGLAAAAVVLVSKCRNLAPVERLLPDLHLVLERDIISDGMAAAEGELATTAVKSVERSKEVIRAAETTASLKASHPGTDIGAMGYSKPRIPSLGERVRELPPPVETFYSKKTLPDGALDEYYSGTNEGIFKLHSRLKVEQSPAMLYRLKNGTELIVPTEFDAQLAEFRAQRLAGSMPNKVRRLFAKENLRRSSPEAEEIAGLDAFVTANGKPGQSVGDLIENSEWTTEKISRALGRDAAPPTLAASKVSELSREIERSRQVLVNRDNPLRNTLMPEDVPYLLKTLPDSSKVKRVYLLNETSEPYKVEQVSAGALDLLDRSPIKLGYAAFARHSEGSITFFKAPGIRNDFSYILAKHEQVHLNHDPAYRVARRLDSPLEASTYGYTNYRESEAELESRVFLSGSVPRFFAAIDKAPLRMSVLANKLVKTIAEAPADLRPTDADQILARANYIRENVIPTQSERVAKVIATVKRRKGDGLDLLLDALKR